MSVVTMKKLKLVGLSSEKKKIVSALVRSGCAQLKPTQQIELTVRELEEKKLDQTASDFSRLTVALEFLSAQEKQAQLLKKQNVLTDADFKAEKKPLLASRTAVSADEFESVELKSDELMNVCKSLEDITERENQINAQNNANANLKATLTPYSELSLKFSSLKDTPHVHFALGLVKNSKTLQSDIQKIEEECNGHIELSCAGNGEKATSYVLFAAVLQENRTQLEGKLAAISFQPCPFDFDLTAKEKLEEIEKETQTLKEQRVQLVKDSLQYLCYRKHMQLLVDNYSLKMEVIKSDGDFAKTQKTFVLEAFVPQPDCDRVEKLLLSTTQNIVLGFEDVTDEDCPPTLLSNPGVIKPYETITDTYSTVNYKESDPNLFVGIFYFIFFGIMLGDFGYGILLTIACFLAVKLLKPEQGLRKLLLVFGMGGISAIVWGVLFDSCFATHPISTILENAGITVSWYPVLDPVGDPITLLIVSFALGVVHIFVGMGMQANDYIKNGKALDAVFDIFSWYGIFVGAGVLILGLAAVKNTVLAVIGGVVLGASVLLLMAGGAIRAKGVGGRLIGAVSPLYGIVNYFSDIMSYSRLFGLCLASGVIGMVFNTLSELVIGVPGIGWLFAGLILLIGHVLNFAIGLLGIYVHDSRLQYIEFFGRFYHGGGKAFAPLGLNLKYHTINKQEV